MYPTPRQTHEQPIFSASQRNFHMETTKGPPPSSNNQKKKKKKHHPRPEPRGRSPPETTRKPQQKPGPNTHPKTPKNQKKKKKKTAFFIRRPSPAQKKRQRLAVAYSASLIPRQRDIPELEMNRQRRKSRAHYARTRGNLAVLTCTPTPTLAIAQTHSNVSPPNPKTSSCITQRHPPARPNRQSIHPSTKGEATRENPPRNTSRTVAKGRARQTRDDAPTLES